MPDGLKFVVCVPLWTVSVSYARGLPQLMIKYRQPLIDDVNPQIFDLRSEANEVSARGDRCVASQRQP